MAQTLSDRIAIVQARIVAIDAILDDLLTCPKPTYTIDATNFKWTEYFEMLTKTRDKLQVECGDLVDARDGHGFSAHQVHVEG